MCAGLRILLPSDGCRRPCPLLSPIISIPQQLNNTIFFFFLISSLINLEDVANPTKGEIEGQGDASAATVRFHR